MDVRLVVRAESEATVTLAALLAGFGSVVFDEMLVATVTELVGIAKLAATAILSPELSVAGKPV